MTPTRGGSQRADYARRVPRELALEISFVDSPLYRGRPAPYNPDTLVAKKGIEIYRKMALDEQVKAALSAKVFAALSTGYSLTLPQSDDDEEKAMLGELREFVEFNFEEMAGSFDSKLLQVMSALTFGFSVSEKLFGYIDYGKFSGKIGLRDLKTRKPDHMDFDADAQGNLAKDGIVQGGSLRMPPEKFVVYSYNPTFGNYYGNSDLRSCYRAWWSKDIVLRYMTITLERYGEPIWVFTHKGGRLDVSVRADLESFVKNLQARTGIIIPDSITSKTESPGPRTAESFIPALNWLDTQIRIGLLMPGLTGLSAEQAVGSFARAVKEFDMFLWIISQLRRDVETVIDEQVVKPLLDLNYEVETGRYPMFKFNQWDEENKQRLFHLWLEAVASGAMKKTPQDENRARELIDMEPLPEEELVEPESPEFGGLFGDGDEENAVEEEFLEFERRLAKMSDRQLARLIKNEKMD